MAGMPRIIGLLKKAGSSSLPATQQLKSFSFTVSGQDSAKTNTDAISRQYPVVSKYIPDCSTPNSEMKKSKCHYISMLLRKLSLPGKHCSRHPMAPTKGWFWDKKLFCMDAYETLSVQ